MKDIILLADPKTSAWEYGEKIQNHISERYKVNNFHLEKVDLENFRNGEYLPHIPGNVRKRDVYYIQSSNKDPSKWWTELLLAKDLCLSASVKSLNFVLPNMLWSRQDRKTKSRVPISARTLAKSLYSPKLERIITMDLHSAQIQGFYDESIPIDNLYSFPTVVEHLRKKHKKDLTNLAIVSPDAGGVTRGMSFINRLKEKNDKLDNKKHNYSFAFTHKLRTKPGEVEKMWFIGNVDKKDVLILDDMIDSGGTLINCKNTLKENGAQKIRVYSTHGLFTEGIEKLVNEFDSIMVSNTHYSPQEGDSKVEMIDMCPMFAEAIYRAQKGISISEMFY